MTHAAAPCPLAADTVARRLEEHRQARIDQIEALLLLDIPRGERAAKARQIAAARAALRRLDRATARLDDLTQRTC